MKVKISVKGYGDLEVNKGISFLEVAKVLYEDEYKNYLGVKSLNRVYPLDTSIDCDMDLEFIDNRDRDGDRILTKTISAVFIMACRELYPNIGVNIDNFLGPGLYARLDRPNIIGLSRIKEIEAKMREIIQTDYSIEKNDYNREEALEILKNHGYEHKVRLFNTVNKSKISIYKINKHIDTFHGYLAPSTGFAGEFKLKYYYPGVIILFPRAGRDYDYRDFKEQKKLAKIFDESSEWLNILDLAFTGTLNERVANGGLNEIIKVSEALHEKKIGQIADQICKEKDTNVILIAGPSSSGKTTFAQRLGIQLKVNGKRPIAISLDDYFVDREKTPVREDGTYDFEALETVDLDLLNLDLVRLLEGETIELPRFNFISGKRERSGRFIKIDKDHPIIIEGIHGLNPRLTCEIPEKNKYKIYISSLTQLNLDPHNRISTTDTRLIRRMVRDVKYRGNDPMRTFELWDGVLAGEEKNIFPYQEEADVMFNSSLVYELSVLKKYVLPLLMEISEDSIFYGEARKLIKFLDYFKDIDDESSIPVNSIIREFIGGGTFDIH